MVIHNPNDNTDWDVESWMNESSDDPEIVTLLWEILGAIIRPNVRWNKSAWFYSTTGNNGKGTLCELMRQLCSSGAYASIPIADFAKRFALEPLITACAIIVDENNVGEFIDKAGNLKAIITNDTSFRSRASTKNPSNCNSSASWCNVSTRCRVSKTVLTIFIVGSSSYRLISASQGASASTSKMAICTGPRYWNMCSTRCCIWTTIRSPNRKPVRMRWKNTRNTMILSGSLSTRFCLNVFGTCCRLPSSMTCIRRGLKRPARTALRKGEISLSMSC